MAILIILSTLPMFGAEPLRAAKTPPKPDFNRLHDYDEVVPPAAVGFGGFDERVSMLGDDRCRQPLEKMAHPPWPDALPASDGIDRLAVVAAKEAKKAADKQLADAKKDLAEPS